MDPRSPKPLVATPTAQSGLLQSNHTSYLPPGHPLANSGVPRADPSHDSQNLVSHELIPIQIQYIPTSNSLKSGNLKEIQQRFDEYQLINMASLEDSAKKAGRFDHDIKLLGPLRGQSLQQTSYLPPTQQYKALNQTEYAPTISQQFSKAYRGIKVDQLNQMTKSKKAHLRTGDLSSIPGSVKTNQYDSQPEFASQEIFVDRYSQLRRSPRFDLPLNLSVVGAQVSPRSRNKLQDMKKKVYSSSGEGQPNLEKVVDREILPPVSPPRREDTRNESLLMTPQEIQERRRDRRPVVVISQKNPNLRREASHLVKQKRMSFRNVEKWKRNHQISLGKHPSPLDRLEPAGAAMLKTSTNFSIRTPLIQFNEQGRTREIDGETTERSTAFNFAKNDDMELKKAVGGSAFNNLFKKNIQSPQYGKYSIRVSQNMKEVRAPSPVRQKFSNSVLRQVSQHQDLDPSFSIEKSIEPSNSVLRNRDQASPDLVKRGSTTEARTSVKIEKKEASKLKSWKNPMPTHRYKIIEQVIDQYRSSLTVPKTLSNGKSSFRRIKGRSSMAVKQPKPNVPALNIPEVEGITEVPIDYSRKDTQGSIMGTTQHIMNNSMDFKTESEPPTNVKIVREPQRLLNNLPVIESDDVNPLSSPLRTTKKERVQVQPGEMFDHSQYNRNESQDQTISSGKVLMKNMLDQSQSPGEEITGNALPSGEVQSPKKTEPVKEDPSKAFGKSKIHATLEKQQLNTFDRRVVAEERSLQISKNTKSFLQEDSKIGEMLLFTQEQIDEGIQVNPTSLFGSVNSRSHRFQTIGQKDSNHVPSTQHISNSNFVSQRRIELSSGHVDEENLTSNSSLHLHMDKPKQENFSLGPGRAVASSSLSQSLIKDFLEKKKLMLALPQINSPFQMGLPNINFQNQEVKIRPQHSPLIASKLIKSYKLRQAPAKIANSQLGSFAASSLASAKASMMSRIAVPSTEETVLVQENSSANQDSIQNSSSPQVDSSFVGTEVASPAKQFQGLDEGTRTMQGDPRRRTKYENFEQFRRVIHPKRPLVPSTFQKAQGSPVYPKSKSPVLEQVSKILNLMGQTQKQMPQIEQPPIIPALPQQSPTKPSTNRNSREQLFRVTSHHNDSPEGSTAYIKVGFDPQIQNAFAGIVHGIQIKQQKRSTLSNSPNSARQTYNNSKRPSKAKNQLPLPQFQDERLTTNLKDDLIITPTQRGSEMRTMPLQLEGQRESTPFDGKQKSQFDSPLKDNLAESSLLKR